MGDGAVKAELIGAAHMEKMRDMAAAAGLPRSRDRGRLVVAGKRKDGCAEMRGIWSVGETERRNRCSPNFFKKIRARVFFWVFG